MKTALITATINVPHVLALYRKYGPDVRFFVAGDLKTPHAAAMGSDVPHFMSAEYQMTLGYKCSELIGWNCIQRRNIALLEALKWGAEVIVSIDDDNIPLDIDYFANFERVLVPTLYPESSSGTPRAFNGLKASSPTGWFDVGQLLQPVSPHRGFPHDRHASPTFDSVVGVRVGVAAGCCLGDPDISAVERIANGPTVHGVSELLRSGVVTDPRNTWTVFNTQNTAFIRELAPAMFCPPGLGRYDDIVASLVTQCVMRERGLHVHFGKPFVWQQRNQHNLVKDLDAELWGMLNVKNIASWLDDYVFEPGIDTTLAQVRDLYRDLQHCAYFPKPPIEAALAFCDDVEKVL